MARGVSAVTRESVFPLIDAMVVLAVIAVLAALSMPGCH